MLLGHRIINGKPREAGGAEFAGIDPTTGARLDPVYHGAGADEVDLAANLAQEAFAVYSRLPGKEKARFLRHIADGLEAIKGEIVDRAHRETALPEGRLEGEAARTINQLRLFAQVVEEGSGDGRASIRPSPIASRCRGPIFARYCGLLGQWLCLAPAIFRSHFQSPGGHSVRIRGR